MYNNQYIIDGLFVESTEAIRARAKSSPCLPERLPSLAFLQREGARSAPIAIIKQIKRHQESVEDHSRRRTASGSLSSQTAPILKPPRIPPVDRPREWKEPQPFEVFRAVERKDVMFLMQVRDHAFHLLLRKSGDATPLLHAMRIGESHREVAILLVGALSRWVNHLDTADLDKPRTRMLLKALRTNLKLAIDYGLQHSQSDLVASYLQTLIMSEGEKWVENSVSSVALALHAGVNGKPVTTANNAVRNFATRELSKAEAIAALEDYIANATLDLLMMGAWSMALEMCAGAKPLPVVYYFARDDRVYQAFQENLRHYNGAISRKAPKRLRWQLKVLEKVGEGRTLTYRRKVEIALGELDEGTGV
ncbi:hypothetical protein BS47DRAFT_1370992 [Hydnum rufescens UP504]|uniref:Uncharacterized protein n=1 Tax=Hydnum rufescens UP504 TaxID=1448309 RepID=A0A9P6B6L1_9AGAM|nr:hypothetical protein BS47DRAFT_1370992 [Hydnum rufescens UP504]